MYICKYICIQTFLRPVSNRVFDGCVLSCVVLVCMCAPLKMGDGNGNFLMDKVQSGWDRKGMQTDLKEEFIIQACVEGHEPTTTIPPLTHVDLLSLADVSIIAEARVRKSRMK